MGVDHYRHRSGADPVGRVRCFSGGSPNRVGESLNAMPSSVVSIPALHTLCDAADGVWGAGGMSAPYV